MKKSFLATGRAGFAVGGRLFGRFFFFFSDYVEQAGRVGQSIGAASGLTGRTMRNRFNNRPTWSEIGFQGGKGGRAFVEDP